MKAVSVRHALLIILSLFLPGCQMSQYMHITNDTGVPVSLEFKKVVKQIAIGETAEFDVGPINSENLAEQEIVIRYPVGPPRRVRLYDVDRSESAFKKSPRYPDVFVSVAELSNIKRSSGQWKFY